MTSLLPYHCDYNALPYSQKHKFLLSKGTFSLQLCDTVQIFSGSNEINRHAHNKNTFASSWCIKCPLLICHQKQRRLQYFKHFKSDKNTRHTVFRDFPQFPHNRSQTLLWTLVKSLTTQQEVWHSSKMSEITLMQIEAQSEFFPLAFHTSCSV